MIFSSIHANDNLKNYPEAIAKAITYVATTDFSKLPDGVYEIDGKRMYAQVFAYTSKPKDECKPELHRKYLDVQFWPCGILHNDLSVIFHPPGFAFYSGSRTKKATGFQVIQYLIHLWRVCKSYIQSRK